MTIALSRGPGWGARVSPPPVAHGCPSGWTLRSLPAAGLGHLPRLSLHVGQADRLEDVTMRPEGTLGQGPHVPAEEGDREATGAFLVPVWSHRPPVSI